MVVWLPSGLEGDLHSKSTHEAHPCNAGAWLVAKIGLVLAAIVLTSLNVTALEIWSGIMPLDDSAAWWALSDE